MMPFVIDWRKVMKLEKVLELMQAAADQIDAEMEELSLLDDNVENVEVEDSEESFAVSSYELSSLDELDDFDI